MEENIESLKPLLKSFFQNFVAIENKKKKISNEYKVVLKILWTNFQEIADTLINKAKIEANFTQYNYLFMPGGKE